MAKPKNSSRRRDRKQRRVLVPIRAEDAVAEAELLPQLRPLSNMPEQMHRLAAIRQLVADLKLARTVYGRHDQIGAEAAMLAVLRVCHALGRPDLGAPFRVIAKGLRDVRASKEEPRIFRQGSVRGRGRRPKSTLEREITITACAFLEILVQDATMPADMAREAIAKILRKKGLDLGQRDTPIAEALKNVRDELSRENCSLEDKEHFRFEVVGLRRDMAPYPQAARQGLLLDLFDDFLFVHLAIPDQTVFYSHGEDA